MFGIIGKIDYLFSSFYNLSIKILNEGILQSQLTLMSLLQVVFAYSIAFSTKNKLIFFF
jgi:hypothetical protein